MSVFCFYTSLSARADKHLFPKSKRRILRTEEATYAGDQGAKRRHERSRVSARRGPWAKEGASGGTGNITETLREGSPSQALPGKLCTACPASRRAQGLPECPSATWLLEPRRAERPARVNTGGKEGKGQLREKNTGFRGVKLLASGTDVSLPINIQGKPRGKWREVGTSGCDVCPRQRGDHKGHCV